MLGFAGRRHGPPGFMRRGGTEHQKPTVADLAVESEEDVARIWVRVGHESQMRALPPRACCRIGSGHDDTARFG